jgi:hypothetical protein
MMKFEISLSVRHIPYILWSSNNFHSGTYQIRMAKSYIQEHLIPSILNEDELEFVVELCATQNDLVRVRFQSRHSNQKHHVVTVQFDETKENPIRDYYCTCNSGSREVGCCVHTAAILWHLGVRKGEIDCTMYPLLAVKLLQAVDDSMQYTQFDDETDDDEDIRHWQ